MASSAIEVGRDLQATIELQTTWGTAIDTSPLILPGGNLEITQEPGNHEVDVQSGARAHSEHNVYNYTTGKLAKVTFDCPVTPSICNLFAFPGILQKNAAWAAAANVWTYTNLEQVDLPLMKTDTDAGYKYTFALRSPTASKSTQVHNAIGGVFDFRWDAEADNGLLMVKTEFIAEGYTETANLAQDGTAISIADAYKWHNEELLFSVNSQVLTNQFKSLNSLAVSYNAHRQGNTTRGDTVFDDFTCKGSIDIWDDTANGTGYCDALSVLCFTTAAGATAGVPLNLGIGDGTLSEAGEMEFNLWIIPRKMTPKPGSDGKVWTFEFECVNGTIPTSLEYAFQAALFVA
jgi:hypothetical protein